MNKNFNVIFFFILFNSISFSFGQDVTPSEIVGTDVLTPGAGLEKPKTPPLIPDAQLYMPETFAPTSSTPPSRDRESIIPTTKPKQKKQSIFRAGFNIGAQYGQFQMLPYSDIYFSPYMQLGPLFFMYELPLRFDWNGTFISQLWTSPAALISKIDMELYYSKTNSVFRHIHLAIKPMKNLIQGHGRFFYDLNPNLYGPYETYKSFMTSIDLSYIGINYTIANIAQPTLMSAEIYIKPLMGLKNPKYETYKDLKIYAVYGLDLDPFQSYSPGLYLFGESPPSPAFSMLEAGIDIPIIQTKKTFALELFADYAMILPGQNQQFQILGGSGISGGILMTFIKKIPIKLEFSQALGYWQPRWMNIFYYVDMPYVDQNSTIIPNKIMTTIPNLTYYTASIGFQWEEKSVFLNAEVFGDTQMDNLWLTLSLTIGQKLLKKFSLCAYWTVRALNKTGIMYDPQNTVLEIIAKYHMLPNMSWGILWKQSGMIGNIIEQNSSGVNVSQLGTAPFQFFGLDFSFRF